MPKEYYCTNSFAIAYSGHSVHLAMSVGVRTRDQPTSCLQVKRDAHIAGEVTPSTQIRIYDVKRAVSRKTVQRVYYGPLPYDFITDIFFALIELVIDGVDSSEQKPRWEPRGTRLATKVS